MELDPNKIDENLDILISAVETYNAEQADAESHILIGPGNPDWPSSHEDHELYPRDYQRFAKKIGWIYYSPDAACLDAKLIEDRLGDMLPDEKGEYDDGYFLDMELGLRFMKDESTSIAEWAESKGIADYLLVAEDPCGYEYLALDKSTNPYTLIELISEIPDSLLEFVIRHLPAVADDYHYH
jgi:hypothetical protein